jgi:ComF family protein
MVDGFGTRWLRRVLPLRCLLCGAPGHAGRDLCSGCAGDLALNHPCCPRCALPLESPAPLCGRCLRREPPFAGAYAPFRYAHPLDLLESRFKFGRDLAAGRVLSSLLAGQALADGVALPQCLVPVPLHVARLRERGYNQALELARPVARALGVPLDRHLVERARATLPQTGLDAAARRRNLHGAFTVIRRDMPLPTHVAVLDDVMTTGSTLAACALALRRAGVARVDVWALARAPAR